MGFWRKRPSRNAPTGDPDLQRFYQAVEAAESGPPTTEMGATVDATALEDIRTSMTRQFDAAQYDDAWRQRVELGYSLIQNGAPSEIWFWVNALPALAALREGERHHPLVATAAGYADEAQRNLTDPNDSIKSAMAEINERFFANE
jgi:hypothetical protein